MKHKIGNIIGAILIVLLLPIAAINLTLTVKSFLDDTKVATVLGYGPLIVETGSMLPVIAPNDLLLVKKVDAEKLEKDDVIAFYDANGIVVSHRIIGYDMDEGGARQYITKGDANNTQDRDPVPAGRVAGKVVRVFPQGGKVFRAISQPIVTVLLVGVPLLLFFAGSGLMKLIANRKQKKEEMEQTDEPYPL